MERALLWREVRRVWPSRQRADLDATGSFSSSGIDFGTTEAYASAAGPRFAGRVCSERRRCARQAPMATQSRLDSTRLSARVCISRRSLDVLDTNVWLGGCLADKGRWRRLLCARRAHIVRCLLPVRAHL